MFLPIAYALSRRIRDFRFLGFSQDHYLYALTALLTMTLAGVWHGAGWTFVVWGTYQGVWLAVDKFLARKPLYRRTPRSVRIAVTFVVTLLGWVFFRSPSVSSALVYVRAMMGIAPHPLAPPMMEIRALPVLIGVCAVVWVWTAPATHVLVPRIRTVPVLLLQIVFLVTIPHRHLLDHVPFLYYQF